MLEPTGIIVSVAASRSIAAIGALGDRERARAALQSLYGVAAPNAPGFVRSGSTTLACLAPGRFLVSGPPDTEHVSSLARSLDGVAAVIDQSDMWETYKVSGPVIREVLARIVPVDVSPTVFGVGGLALTRAGHLDIRLWRVARDDYEISVTRSHAEDLLHALQTCRRQSRTSQ